MKRLAKILGALVGVLLLGFLSMVTGVRWIWQRTERAVIDEVARLEPGTSFSTAVERLGKPDQVFTNSEEMLAWVKQVGSHVEEQVATNSVLHAFVHRGPPFRYILVYTDLESQKVIRANWCGM